MKHPRKYLKCMRCKEIKPESKFYKASKNKTGRGKWCKKCIALVYSRKNQLLDKYGLTLIDYGRIWDEQGGVCAICKKPDDSGKSLAVDHDHATGKVRGLLCQKCNSGLGLFRDDSGLILEARNYLKQHS